MNDKRERKERWSRRWEATQGHSGLGDHDQVFGFYSKNKKKLGGIFTRSDCLFRSTCWLPWGAATLDLEGG